MPVVGFAMPGILIIKHISPCGWVTDLGLHISWRPIFPGMWKQVSWVASEREIPK